MVEETLSTLDGMNTMLVSLLTRYVLCAGRMFVPFGTSDLSMIELLFFMRSSISFCIAF